MTQNNNFHSCVLEGGTDTPFWTSVTRMAATISTAWLENYPNTDRKLESKKTKNSEDHTFY